MSLATFSAIGSDSRIDVELPTTLAWPSRRVKLVSMDFPASQRGIEDGWSCMYYSEAIRVTDDARVVTVLVTRNEGEDEVEELHTSMLPLTSNRIVSVAHANGRIQFTTCCEHGLFVRGTPIISLLESVLGQATVPLTLIHSRGGAMAITSADDLRYVSAFTVSLPSRFANGDCDSSAGLSDGSSDGSLSGSLTGSSDGSSTGSSACQTCGYFVVPPVTTPAALCALLAGSFANRINFSFSALSGRTSVSGSPGLTVKSVGGDTLAQWLLGFDGVFTAWEVARIPPCSLSPVAFAAVLQSCLNRYEVLPESTCLMYRDPLGATHEANILAGQYRTPRALAAAVHRAMQPNMPHDFNVAYDGSAVRFACSAPFDLLLCSSGHSLCVALGYAQSDRVGLKEYISDFAVHSHSVRPNSNTYEVTIEDHCLQLASRAMHVAAKVESYRRSVLRVRTSDATGAPMAHGGLCGDTVTICESGCTGPRLRRTRRILGVVVADEGGNDEADLLCIHVPDHGWAEAEPFEPFELVILMPHTDFSICALVPSSTSTYFENATGGARLGFRDEVVFAGNGTLRAPYPPSLEHPSRVLVFVEDANGDAHSTEPEHVFDDRRIFAQVLVNERRVAPAVARLRTEGSSLRLRFMNMDRTPYIFNNATVVFTLELS